MSTKPKAAPAAMPKEYTGGDWQDMSGRAVALQPGESVDGYFLGVEPARDKDSSNVLQFQRHGTEESVKLFSSFALDAVLVTDKDDAVKEQLGRRFFMRFDGAQKRKGGKTFKAYTIVRHRTDKIDVAF
jgi:hypothetical protein